MKYEWEYKVSCSDILLIFLVTIFLLYFVHSLSAILLAVSGQQKSTMEQHEAMVMSKILPLGQREGFSCLECDYTSTMKSNMRHHVESRHLDLTYLCTLCNKTQKSYKAWYSHSKTH